MLAIIWFQAAAQIPPGYYNAVEGLSGPELKTALKLVIDNHYSLTYSQLWSAFEETDMKANGMVWDMYSDVPGGTPSYQYQFFTNQCGNYSREGDCYNREHSFPKSWFHDATPMYTDLFHIVPSDGYVNGKRSNDPFGEVKYPSWTSTNGSRSGPCSWPGYTGNVFEPIDEYKGDFARGYFYMVTRYENQLNTWDSPMLDRSTFPAFTHWALSLLIHWHQIDPVSPKEINRNNAIYQWQNNRNPFIDNPEYVNLIWGEPTPALAFTSTPATSVVAGSQYQYTVTTSGGISDNVVISCSRKPDWLTFTTAPNHTALLQGTPSAEQQGSFPITLEATDGISTVIQNYNITVTLNAPVVNFASIPVTNTTINSQYVYVLSATVDGNPSPSITYRDIILPEWLTMVDMLDGTAVVFGYASPDDSGPHPVEIKASFGEYSASQEFLINVHNSTNGSSYTETFTLMPATSSSYSSRSWTGDHGFSWSAAEARTDQSIDGRALCFKDTGTAALRSQTLQGGVNTVTFSHQQKFTGTGGTITLLINDKPIGNPVTVTTETATVTFENINISGEFTMKLESNGASRIAIDNLSWSGATAAQAVPLFGNINSFPSSPLKGSQVIISAHVYHPENNISLVYLEYGTDASLLSQRIDMVHENFYTADFIFPLQAEKVYYRIIAQDAAGKTAISPMLVIPAMDQQSELQTLTINTRGNGTTIPSAGVHTYTKGSSVEIIATAEPGWRFLNWSYNGSISTQPVIQIIIGDDTELTATFEEQTGSNPVEYFSAILYPNPFTDELFLTAPHNISTIIFYDLSGRVQLKIDNPTTSINTSSLPAGLFLVVAIRDNGDREIFKRFKTYPSR